MRSHSVFVYLRHPVTIFAPQMCLPCRCTAKSVSSGANIPAFSPHITLHSKDVRSSAFYVVHVASDAQYMYRGGKVGDFFSSQNFPLVCMCVNFLQKVSLNLKTKNRNIFLPEF